MKVELTRAEVIEIHVCLTTSLRVLEREAKRSEHTALALSLEIGSLKGILNQLNEVMGREKV